MAVRTTRCRLPMQTARWLLLQLDRSADPTGGHCHLSASLEEANFLQIDAPLGGDGSHQGALITPPEAQYGD